MFLVESTYKNLMFWLARHLPRDLVYFSGIVLWLNGTSGKWEDQEVPALLMVEALQRWEES